jgi:hypothetical protein
MKLMWVYLVSRRYRCELCDSGKSKAILKVSDGTFHGSAHFISFIPLQYAAQGVRIRPKNYPDWIMY